MNMTLSEHRNAARRRVEMKFHCNGILRCESFADEDKTAWAVTIYRSGTNETERLWWVVHEGDDLKEHLNPLGLPEMVQCCIEDIWYEVTGTKLGLVGEPVTREDFDRLRQKADRLETFLIEMEHEMEPQEADHPCCADLCAFVQEEIKEVKRDLEAMTI